MRERLKRLGQGSSVTEGTVAVMGSSRGESGTTSGRESERKGSALVALLTSRRWERWAPAAGGLRPIQSGRDRASGSILFDSRY